VKDERPYLRHVSTPSAVVVDEHVAHPGDLRPRDVGVERSRLRPEVERRLPELRRAVEHILVSR